MTIRSLTLLLLVLLSMTAAPRDADAQVPTGVKFDQDMCDLVDGMVDANGSVVMACKNACDATTIDNAFVANATACLANVHKNPRDPERLGQGRDALPALPWVTIVTDFFVARLKGEAALFLKTQVAAQVCPADSKSVTAALLPRTCGVLLGADGFISALPAAFRADVDALPSNLFQYAIKLAGKTLPLGARDAICVGAVLPLPLAALRRDGPYVALKKVTEAVAPHDDCNKPVEQARDVASWILAILDTLNDSKGNTPTRKEVARDVHLASMSLLAGRVPKLSAQIPAAALTKAVEALGDRWKEVEPLITELIMLIRQIEQGERDPLVVDRAAELTVLVTVALLDFDEVTKSDLSAAARAISALATKRYLEGVLAIFSIQTLDDYLSKHDKTKKVWTRFAHWAPVLGALADAKSAEDAHAVLEAAAAPLGSYREFTQGGWKGFISGWAGIGGGSDLMFEAGNQESNAGVVGPMLPIGFEVGRSLDGGPTSIQVLISLIDVGALAVARFDADADSGTEGPDGKLRVAPEPSFSSVFAPGAFIGVRPGKLPFVIGGGAELLPKAVVKFDCDEGQTTCEDTTAVPTIRFMAFIAFDLTAFRIF
jgi:hypothetical protein